MTDKERLARQRKIYHTDPDKVLERQRKYRRENPEKCREYQKEYRKRNLDLFRERDRKRRKTHPKTPEQRRDAQLKHHFGISLDEFNALLTSQGNKCACCGTDKPGGQGGFHVDHCHDTGRVRGILCCNCNRGVGYLGDNAEGVRRALDYLAKTK